MLAACLHKNAKCYEGRKVYKPIVVGYGSGLSLRFGPTVRLSDSFARNHDMLDKWLDSGRKNRAKKEITHCGKA